MNATAAFAEPRRGPLALLCLGALLVALWLALPGVGAAAHCADDGASAGGIESSAGCCADCATCEPALALRPEPFLTQSSAPFAGGVVPRPLIAGAPPPLPPPIASSV